MFLYAWTSAWSFFGSKVRDAIIFVVLLSVGGAAYYRLYGLPATQDQVIPVLIFTVGPMVGLWMLLFLGHLWMAPYALIYEVVNQRGTLKQPELSSNPVNWNVWKRRERYSIYEFAKILAKDEPASQEMTQAASTYARLMLEAVELDKLKYVARHTETYNIDFERIRKEIEPDYHTEISRNAALEWAASNSFVVDHIA